MERSIQSYQSAWMTHWTGKNWNEGIHSINQSTNSLGKKENIHDTSGHQPTCKLEIAMPSTSGPSRGFKSMECITRSVHHDSLRMTLRAENDEHLGGRPFDKVGSCRSAGTGKALKDNQAVCNIEPLLPQNNHNIDYGPLMTPMRRVSIPSLHLINHHDLTTPSTGLHSESEVRFQSMHEPIKTLNLFRDGSFAASSPLAEEEPYNMQSGLDNSYSGEKCFSSFRDKSALASKGPLPLTNLKLSEYEDFDTNKHSSFLLREGKGGMCPKSGRSMAACFGETVASPFQSDPLTSNDHSPPLGREPFQKMWNFSGLRHVLNQSNLPIESGKLRREFKSLEEFHSSVNDVETMRICTTVDSVVGGGGEHSRVSQTTHSFLITKKANFNLFKPEQNFGNSRGPSECETHQFSNLNREPSTFGHIQHGIKHQPRCGFSDTEVQRVSEELLDVSRLPKGDEKNVKEILAFEVSRSRKGKMVAHDIVCGYNLENEQSAETHNMDLTNFEEKALGVTSSPSVKMIKLGTATPRLALFHGSEKGGCRQLRTNLPDMNLELPTSPAEEPSVSRTQSLDIETVLAHAERISPSESDNSLKPEPGNRWLKRLKFSAPNLYSVGTKSSSFGEELPHKTNNLLLLTVPEGSRASSEPPASRDHERELMVVDKATTLTPQGESSYTDSVKKDRDLLLSHSWIKRWCHCKAATEKKLSQELVCGDQRSKLLLEFIPKKDFPSIAAMALMAKVMSGFQPCDIQDKGSFVVWNTKGFLKST